MYARVVQKVDFGVKELSYPYFRSGLNSTEIIMLTR